MTTQELKEKFPVGTKVVPHSKTVKGYGGLECCCKWVRAKEIGQPFLYVVNYGFEDGRNILILNNNKVDFGNFYNVEDVTYYEKYTQVTESTPIKVGDVLKVKDVLLNEDDTADVGKNSSMLKCCGKELTVHYIGTKGNNTYVAFEGNIYNWSLGWLLKKVDNINTKEEKKMLKISESNKEILESIRLGQKFYTKNGEDGWFKFGCVVEYNGEKYVINGFKMDDNNEVTSLSAVKFFVKNDEFVFNASYTFLPENFEYLKKIDRYGFEYCSNIIKNTVIAPSKKDILNKQIAEAEAKLQEMKKEISTL